MPRIARPLARLVVLGLAFGRMSAPAAEFEFHHENVMGTSLELRVHAPSRPSATAAEARALAEIDRLSALLSNHDPASEFRRWQAAPRGPRAVSPELATMLASADRWRAATGGAFCPAVQALTDLWTEAGLRGREPSPEELDAAKAAVARPSWRVDQARGVAERLSDGPWTLDAIAKGFIAERAAEMAMKGDEGVSGVLLNVGGDLRVRGDFEARVAIADPFADSEGAGPLALASVRDRAIATSGRSQRAFRVGARRYSHILDPRTGRPVEGVASATVIAGSSADADALATALNVLSPEEGLGLIERVPGAACLIVGADGRAHRSARWAAFEAPIAARSGSPRALAEGPPQDPAPRAWGDDFELEIAFEINQPEKERGRYRRPYVAVWVENEDGYPIRTLLLWLSQGGAGPDKWVPDLKRWYRADQQRKETDDVDLVHTFSRPTRPPGKYSVTWDGKDASGKPLPPGEYTLFIEAAREHGTNQGIKKVVTLADAPFTEDLKGNVEIKSASLAYRRKASAK